MTKHLGGKRLTMLCSLLSIKRISGRNSAPKLTLDTEYISRESRAVAAMTLVRQAAACQIAVLSGIERETWITGDRSDYRTAGGWIPVVIMTCCILDESPTRSATEHKLWKRASVFKTSRRESWSRSTAGPRTADVTAHSSCKAHATQSRGGSSHCDPHRKSALGGGALGCEHKFWNLSVFVTVC